MANKEKKKNSSVGTTRWTILIAVVLIIGLFFIGKRMRDILDPESSNSTESIFEAENVVVENKIDWDKESEKYKVDLEQQVINLESLRTFETTIDNLNAQRIILDDAQLFYKKLLSKDSINVRLNKDIEVYKKDLIKTQKLIYPKFRKVFTENAKKQMWEHDIKVYSSGTTITFMGYTFAKNKNIKDSYESIATTLKELRFKRVNFKWNEGSEYTYYTIDSPTDSNIE